MTKESTGQAKLEIPYSRWFYYLAIGSLITFVEPYFTSRSSRIWSSDIQTFVEVGTTTQPTAEHIWLDGRTAAMLASRSWLLIAAGFICIECVVGGSRYLILSQKKRKVRMADSPSEQNQTEQVGGCDGEWPRS